VTSTRAATGGDGGGPGVAGAIARFTPEERARLIELRRKLHASPELSWQERGTQATLRAALAACGITDVGEVAGTGLVARIPGTRSGVPVVALRGDIDALPITEETGLPFASRNPGVMHACGHDMHAAWTVAAGMLLAKRPAEGEVRLVFQPAEEVGEGAAKVLESGALDGVTAIFGGHVDWRFPVGEVVATAGPLAASTDTFAITFHGKGGHGARPQDAIDPIVGLAAFIMEAQTIVSRLLDPALPGVVTVGAVMAGEASNVIPERARCAGTIRATTPDVRALLTSELRRVAQAVATVHRLTAEVELTEGTPPLVNTAKGAAWAQEAARALLGEGALKSLASANMGGEDFAYYLERLEGCFMRIGTWREGRSRAGVHTPRFDPDEDAILVGGALLAECARVASGVASVPAGAARPRHN
jgi:amidohydrolase